MAKHHNTPSEFADDLANYESVISVFGHGDQYEAGPPLTKYHFRVEEFLEANRRFCKALDLYEGIGKNSTDDDLRRWFLREDFKKTIGMNCKKIGLPGKLIL